MPMSASSIPEPTACETASDGGDADVAFAFRPTKKRKVFRTRGGDLQPEENMHVEKSASSPGLKASPDRSAGTDTVPSLTELPAFPPGGPDDDVQATDDSLALLRRQRYAQRRRQQGIEFGVTKSSTSAEPSQREDHHARNTDAQATNTTGVETKFAPQRGYTANVDHHMMAYVDAELARRKLSRVPNAIQLQSPSPPPASDDGMSPVATAAASDGPAGPRARQPATIGKIHEVELASVPAPAVRAPKPPRVRRGRDGRVLPPRPRQPRRTSADRARDALVESLLHEHRPGDSGGIVAEDAEPVEDAEMTDERLAELFRREYMERESHGQAAREKKARDETAPRGPKLGGSRSARAAMREREVDAARKGKKA